MRHDRTMIDTESGLTIERASGEVVTILPNSWEYDEFENRLFIVTHKNDNLETVHSFVRVDPPVSVHLPVQTLSASENEAQKSEKLAYTPKDIERYSIVTNTSDSPDCSHDFTAGVLEIWLDEGNESLLF